MNKLMIPFKSFPLIPRKMFDDFTEGFFDDFFNSSRGFDPNTLSLTLRSFPKGDTYVNKDGDHVIELALAGYIKDQLSVSIEDNHLIVSASKCEKGDDECESRSIARRAFKTIFSNPGEDFDLKKSTVTFENGLLKIVTPKAERKQDKIVELDIK